MLPDLLWSDQVVLQHAGREVALGQFKPRVPLVNPDTLQSQVSLVYSVTESTVPVFPLAIFFLGPSGSCIPSDKLQTSPLRCQIFTVVSIYTTPLSQQHFGHALISDIAFDTVSLSLSTISIAKIQSASAASFRLFLVTWTSRDLSHLNSALVSYFFPSLLN